MIIGVWYGFSVLFLLNQPVSETWKQKLSPMALAKTEALASEQKEKFWIFFDAKPGEHPLPLNPHVQKRRSLRASNAFKQHELDVPVSQRYLGALEALELTPLIQSRWLNAVSLLATPGQVEQLAQLPFVRGIRLVAKGKRQPLSEHPSPLRQRTGKRGLSYGNSLEQLEQINLVALHEAGFTGEGVILGILDTGFKRTHVAFNEPGHEVSVVAEYDFVNDDPNTAPEAGDPSGQHDHGTYILGCIGAFKPGELIGGAPDVRFILCKTEDTAGEYPAEEDQYVAGVEFAEEHGADVITASLGYIDWYDQDDLDGQTAVTSVIVNTATSLGVHFCNAAGNEGHDSDPNTSHLIAPADAFDVISCGAVALSGSIASFSSDGPTADGRLKPELLARGSSTDTVSPSSDTAYTGVDGTSLSTPLVAAAVACLTQARPDWTVEEMRQALFHTASDYVANGQSDPLMVRGFGILNAMAAITDCNGNGRPDLAEVAQGLGSDCNGNGLLDECDIAEGRAEDCNGNGIPDACDLTPGALQLTETLGPVLGWQDVSDFGTPLGLGDDEEASLTLEFANGLFGSQMVVGNNGGIGFLPSGSLGVTNAVLPSTEAFGGAHALLAFWDDLDSDTGDVFVATLQEAPQRLAVIQWQDRPHYSGNSVLDGDELTFQIQLFETPRQGIWAQILYADVDAQNSEYNGGASATVGYQDGQGNGQTFSYQQPTLTTATCLSLIPGAPAASADDNQNGIPDECEGCLGDLNQDQEVTWQDFLAGLSHWGQSTLNADLDRDGKVTLQDYILWMTSLGPCN